MPTAVEYVPPTSSERNNFYNVLAREYQSRSSQYYDALNYYNGVHAQQLVIEDDTPDDNVYKQLVKQTADRTISFLFPSVPTIELDPNSISETPAELWVREFLDFNGGLHSMTKLGLRGFLSGHVFARVIPNSPYPRFHSLDPLSVNVYWKADEISDVVWYEQRFFVGDNYYIKDFVNQGNGTWKIYTYQGQTQSFNSVDFNTPTHHGRDMVSVDNNMYTHIDSGSFKLVKTENHTYYIPPIFDCPHLPNPNGYYGLSEFNPAFKKLQDTINRVASERSASTRENFEPVDVITGADQDEVDAEGSVITVANPSAKVYRLQTKSDGAGINEQLQDLINDYLLTSRVVILKGKPADLQRVTNASLKALFLDQINKTNILRSSYGAMLADVIKVALLMGYKQGTVDINPANIKPIVLFPEPLPMDAKEIVDTNAIAINAGFMSRRTASTRLGLRWDAELDAMEAEKETFAEPEPEVAVVEEQEQSPV